MSGVSAESASGCTSQMIAPLPNARRTPPGLASLVAREKKRLRRPAQIGNANERRAQQSSSPRSAAGIGRDGEPIRRPIASTRGER